MEKEYILAFDVGTTSIKAIVIHRSGKLVGQRKVSVSVTSLHPGWAEQDPQALWEALCIASRGALQSAQVSGNAVMGMAIAAPWKHIILIDGAGIILRKSIIWADGRGGSQAERLNQRMGEFVGTGQEYWPRLMWVKENEPELWQRTMHIMGLNTFFKWKATGRIFTEPSDDFIHSCQSDVQARYDRILDAAGLLSDLNKFPPMLSSIDKVGEITPSSAIELGVAVGTPVFGGFGDLAAVTIGSGCCSCGQAHVYIGTSGWIVILDSSRQNLSPSLWFSFDNKREGAVYSLQCAGRAFDWVVEQFYHKERQELGDDIFTLVNNDIASIPAGSDNLIATHWLTGELPPLGRKNANAVFFNITANHDRRHFLKAVMESVCYSLRYLKELLETQSDNKLDSIRLVGGGAESLLWGQCMADILGIPIEIPVNPRYAGAMGVFSCVMLGLGQIADYSALYSSVKIAHTFFPIKENQDVYGTLYRAYRDLLFSLQACFNTINAEY